MLTATSGVATSSGTAGVVMDEAATGVQEEQLIIIEDLTLVQEKASSASSPTKLDATKEATATKDGKEP